MSFLLENFVDFSDEELLKWKQENTVTEKQCTYCLIVKPISNFSKNVKYYNILDGRCKKCKNKTSNTTENLKKVAVEKPEVCDCCKRPKKLYLDHDHKTLEIRGWLCNNCNTSLGKLGDDILGLKNALAYLEEDKTAYNTRNRYILKE